MTGFGEARSQADGMAVAVEVRTINSRHFKLSFRASEGYAALEPEVEAVTREIDSPRHRAAESARRSPRVGRRLPHQHGRARELSPAARDSTRAAASGTIPTICGCCSSLPGAVDETSRADHDPRDDWPAIEPVLREALAATRQDAGRGRRRAGRRPGPQRPADCSNCSTPSPSARPKSRSRTNRG